MPPWEVPVSTSAQEVFGIEPIVRSVGNETLQIRRCERARANEPGEKRPDAPHRDRRLMWPPVSGERAV